MTERQRSPEPPSPATDAPPSHDSPQQSTPIRKSRMPSKASRLYIAHRVMAGILWLRGQCRRASVFAPPIYSKVLFFFDRLRQRLSIYLQRHSMAAAGLVFIVLASASMFLILPITQFLSPHVTHDTIASLALALGSAWIGGAALAFTLIMFAMQVNVDRVPHGLFNKFSTDPKFLLCFITIFIIALGMTFSSLLVTLMPVGATVVAACLSSLLITCLLWYAYRRALLLISPWAQLSLLLTATDKSLQRTVRRAKRLHPILSADSEAPQHEHVAEDTEFNMARAALFKMDPNWAVEAHRAVSFSIAYATRASEEADYETSLSALKTIEKVNISYIRAKGKTFIGNTAFAALIGSHGQEDPLVQHTLEHLRQYSQLAIGRNDERQIQQVFNTLAELTRHYLSIEYAVAGETKHYSGLGSLYLSTAVTASLSIASTDVMMDGVQTIGSVARMLINGGMKSHSVTAAKDLHLIAASCLSEPDLEMTVGVIMSEYAKILVSLILLQEHELRVEFEELQKHICSIALLLVEIPDTTIQGKHSRLAQSFYSIGYRSSLSEHLSRIASEIVQAKTDDAAALHAARNLGHWADHLWEPHRKLLITSVYKKSSLTFDLVHWISHVSQVLIAVADAPVTDASTAHRIRDAASWLALTLTHYPNSGDYQALAERDQLAEQMLSIAIAALRHGCRNITTALATELLNRGVSSAGATASYSALTTAVQSQCVLAAIDSRAESMTSMSALVLKHLPDRSVLPQTARDDIAKWILRREYAMSPMGIMMNKVDQDRLREALEICADLLKAPT